MKITVLAPSLFLIATLSLVNAQSEQNGINKEDQLPSDSILPHSRIEKFKIDMQAIKSTSMSSVSSSSISSKCEPKTITKGGFFFGNPPDPVTVTATETATETATKTATETLSQEVSLVTVTVTTIEVNNIIVANNATYIKFQETKTLIAPTPSTVSTVLVVPNSSVASSVPIVPNSSVISTKSIAPVPSVAFIEKAASATSSSSSTLQSSSVNLPTTTVTSSGKSATKSSSVRSASSTTCTDCMAASSAPFECIAPVLNSTIVTTLPPVIVAQFAGPFTTTLAPQVLTLTCPQVVTETHTKGLFDDFFHKPTPTPTSSSLSVLPTPPPSSTKANTSSATISSQSMSRSSNSSSSKTQNASSAGPTALLGGRIVTITQTITQRFTVTKTVTAGQPNPTVGGGFNLFPHLGTVPTPTTTPNDFSLPSLFPPLFPNILPLSGQINLIPDIKLPNLANPIEVIQFIGNIIKHLEENAPKHEDEPKNPLLDFITKGMEDIAKMPKSQEEQFPAVIAIATQILQFLFPPPKPFKFPF